MAINYRVEADVIDIRTDTNDRGQSPQSFWLETLTVVN